MCTNGVFVCMLNSCNYIHTHDFLNFFFYIILYFIIRTNNILGNSVCPLNIIPKMARNTEKVIMHCHTKHSMVCLIHHRQFELYTSERMDILFIILNFSLAKYFIFQNTQCFILTDRCLHQDIIVKQVIGLYIDTSRRR